MSHYSIEAIRANCPVIQNGEDEETIVPVVDKELYSDSLVKTNCCASPDQKIKAGISYGCREVTGLSSTGCPLRNGDTVTVQI